ncbi:MAG: hypothetical protein P4L10_07900 [Acidobacteriaceae bacterium]|nr:hypothetical protein [Acidobacteriaceae bacterium]
MSDIPNVEESPTSVALARIQEVRVPLGFRPPRGWLTVGLSDTLTSLSVPVVLVLVGGYLAWLAYAYGQQAMPLVREALRSF